MTYRWVWILDIKIIILKWKFNVMIAGVNEINIMSRISLINIQYLLLDFFIRLLLVVLQVHDGLLGQFQVSLQLSLASLKVHTELLLLLQRTFKLEDNTHFSYLSSDVNSYLFITCYISQLSFWIPKTNLLYEIKLISIETKLNKTPNFARKH